MDSVSSIVGDLPLLILVVALVAYWVLAYFLLYHLTRFGVGTEPKLVSFVFLLGSIALTIITIIIYVQMGHSVLNSSVNQFL